MIKFMLLLSILGILGCQVAYQNGSEFPEDTNGGPSLNTLPDCIPKENPERTPCVNENGEVFYQGQL